MKENPEDQLGAESPGNEVTDLRATAPLNEAEFALTRDPEQDSQQFEPAIQRITGELSQAPPIVYVAVSPNPPKPIVLPPPVATELDGIAANGGAVGAVVLGVWSILGSLLTYWSLINGILGLALGVWGLGSKRPRTAWIGICLCLIGAFMSMAAVSEIISNFWSAPRDSNTP